MGNLLLAIYAKEAPTNQTSEFLAIVQNCFFPTTWGSISPETWEENSAFQLADYCHVIRGSAIGQVPPAGSLDTLRPPPT
ncbi:hypothetical protein TgHK011_008041 [Trichoderma gracile]|nr:hypothetical protein TgHK011_008041 [Trichoderma gracile]